MTYLSSVLADNPTHFWRLADPGGVLAQDIGSGPRFPLFCDYQFAFPYSGPASDGGAAVRLPANHITTGPSFILPVGLAWTIEIWYWLPWDDATLRALLTLVQAGAVHPLEVYLQTTNCLGGAIPGVGGFNSAVPSPPRTWHQAALTYDNATMKVVFDGVQLGTASFVSASTGNYGVAVGTDASGTSTVQGFLAEAAVYPTALSTARLLAHYAAADFKAFNPIYAGGGSINPSTGAGEPSSTDLAAILAAVRKTY